MATFEITMDDEKIQDLLRGDRGLAALLEPLLNQMLQAEMTEHLDAEPDQRTDTRQGYRNGSYERQLTTRVGTIELECLGTETAAFKPLFSKDTSGRRRPW